MLAILLLAPFLGLDNFALSVALGLERLTWDIYVYVVTLFGSLAVLAILLGSTVGTASAAWLGPSAQYVGGSILIALGAYQLWHERAAVTGSRQLQTSRWALGVAGIGVSLDTVVAGVAFGLRGDPIVSSAVIVGIVTAALSFAGLRLGGFLGRWTGRVSSRIAPTALVLVGVGIAGGVL